MKTTDFDYELPPELIAQTPIEPRDAARLLVLEKKSGKMTHTVFRELGRYLTAGDVMVLNQTRVIQARLIGRKYPSGGRVELLLLKRLNPLTWEVLVGGKGMSVGKSVIIYSGPQATIEQELDGALRVVRFSEPVEPYLSSAGHVPLPPYIHESLPNPERYQTVYSNRTGSAAAPTAGLHFTTELLQSLETQGVNLAYVTLHVGLDTFAPVTEEMPAQHLMHTEWCQMPAESAAIINRARKAGKRIIAVGTTSVRTLESAAPLARPGETVTAFEGPTELFILPGYSFSAVDVLVTNFHLPRSTLIMLVSAFAGRERVLAAYREAIAQRYRFYSFGDAMLIL